MRLITVVIGLGILFGQVALGQATPDEQADHFLKKIYDKVAPEGVAEVNMSDAIKDCRSYFKSCFPDAHSMIFPDPWDGAGGWCQAIPSGVFTSIKPDVVKMIQKYKITKHNDICDKDQDPTANAHPSAPSSGK